MVGRRGVWLCGAVFVLPALVAMQQQTDSGVHVGDLFSLLGVSGLSILTTAVILGRKMATREDVAKVQEAIDKSIEKSKSDFDGAVKAVRDENALARAELRLDLLEAIEKRGPWSKVESLVMDRLARLDARIEVVSKRSHDANDAAQVGIALRDAYTDGVHRMDDLLERLIQLEKHA